MINRKGRLRAAFFLTARAQVLEVGGLVLRSYIFFLFF
jgi:hypothetical protein